MKLVIFFWFAAMSVRHASKQALNKHRNSYKTQMMIYDFRRIKNILSKCTKKWHIISNIFFLLRHGRFCNPIYSYSYIYVPIGVCVVKCECARRNSWVSPNRISDHYAYQLAHCRSVDTPTHNSSRLMTYDTNQMSPCDFLLLFDKFFTN